MRKVLVFGIMMGLFINCGGNDNEIVNPEPQDIVEAVNDSFKADEDTPIVLSTFLENDTFKPDNFKITFEGTSEKNGTITKNGNEFTYTPLANFVGVDSFKYTICSTISTNSCSTAVITITVRAGSSNTGNSGSFNIPSDLTAYYNGVDFSLTESALKNALAVKIINTHSTNLSYTPGVWDVLKLSDLDPTDNSKVLLIYGYNDNDGNSLTDRTRSKDDNGGSTGNWNREHVYPRSLGNPNLGDTGPGSDAHHLRPSDIRANSTRSNQRFADGSGNAGNVSGGWYPGDEWKGDVARMMMYMYLRYDSQCLPKNVAMGTVSTIDANMVQLLLEWNVEDPVSDFEKNRNNIIKEEQGNRNPFIDNPYLATIMWGGADAENTWR